MFKIVRLLKIDEICKKLGEEEEKQPPFSILFFIKIFSLKTDF